MLIKISDSEFEAVQLVDGTLKVHESGGAIRKLEEEVEDIALVVVHNVLHLVAFLKSGFAWHYVGLKTLLREPVDLDYIYQGGGHLIADGLGQVHLFYFGRETLSQSPTLRHKIYNGIWSSSLLVTTNINACPTNFSVLGAGDFLHLVYCLKRQGHLLYQAFDLEERLWSGAVVLRAVSCYDPQLIPAKGLCLLWLEGENQDRVLYSKKKNETWSGARQISHNKGNLSSIGYAYDGQWSVFWFEESEFFQKILDSQGNSRSLVPHDYQLRWRVLEVPGWGSFQLACYERKEPTSEQLKAAAGTLVLEEKEWPPVAEKVFEEAISQIFTEWTDLKAELREWQKNLIDSQLPPFPDLTVLGDRLDRLESRFTIEQRKQGQEKENRKGEWEELQSHLTRLNRRLLEIETKLQDKPVNIWRRVIGRD